MIGGIDYEYDFNRLRFLAQTALLVETTYLLWNFWHKVYGENGIKRKLFITKKVTKSCTMVMYSLIQSSGFTKHIILSYPACAATAIGQGI